MKKKEVVAVVGIKSGKIAKKRPKKEKNVKYTQKIVNGKVVHEHYFTDEAD